MKPQQDNPVTVQRLDESKSEIQMQFRDRLPQNSHKTMKNQNSSPSSNFNNSLLVLLSVVLFAVIFIAINQHYSKMIVDKLGRIQKEIEQQPETIDKIKESLIKSKDSSESERNEEGSSNVNQLSFQIKQLNQQIASSNELKKQVKTLSSQLALIKNDISALAKTIEKGNSELGKELKNIKELNQKKAEDAPEKILTKFSENYVDDKYVFDIPKKLWLYEPDKSTYLKELIHDNNRYFAKKSKFDVFILNNKNYKDYLSQKGAEAIQKLISFLEKQVKSGQNSKLKNHIQSIIKKLILLTVLKENGGVMTNGEFVMTEDFKWINDIVRNQYVNRGNRGIKPQVVGFYVPYYSFEKAKENIKPFEGMYPVDKYMLIFPSLEDYFMAAAPNTPFLNALLTQITKLLTNPDNFKRERGKYKMNRLNGDDMYFQYIYIASQIVLQQKQKEIDQVNIDQYRHFAIDYYGLHLLNCHFGPQKFKMIWQKESPNPYKIFQILTQYPLEQLEANIGPMRYMVHFLNEKQINDYLQQTKNGNRKKIIDGSLIQRILFPDSKAPFFRKNQEKSIVNNTSQPWLTLPKIIWVFWDKGLANARSNNQVCIQNMRRMGKQSGFELREVNLSNAHQYLDKQTLDRINTVWQNPSKLINAPQHLSDLYRLALVSKHGGIYMDSSYIAIQNFDWLINIGKYPSQYIFNRYGSLPKVFMIFHPHGGFPGDWQIDLKYNTKSQWHLAYQNNFIAAEKGSELVTEWFNLLLELAVKPYSEVEKVFQDSMIIANQWGRKGFTYLLPMDTINCVIGRKEVELRKKGSKQYVSASDYYKIWSVSGYLGQQKLRANTNFDVIGGQYDNKLVYQYSQEYAEGLVGKLRQLFKFYGWHNKLMTDFESRHMDGDFSQVTHPDSFFMRYMWDKRYKLVGNSSHPKLQLPD